jgi:hypothetical protein
LRLAKKILGCAPAVAPAGGVTSGPVRPEDRGLQDLGITRGQIDYVALNRSIDLGVAQSAKADGDGY